MGESVVRLWSRDGATARAQPPPPLRSNSSRKRRRQPVEDASAATEDFDAAQSQLRAEMAAAGLEGALPMSFGGSRNRKRRRVANADTCGQAEKVHVTFDSDGEVAERRVEAVDVPVERRHEEAETDAQSDAGGDPMAAVEEESPRQHEEIAVPKEIRKFWLQRKHLFYKYDDGILLDHESWYSVTPQAIAEHIADRLQCDVVVDPFAGCGGNVIQLARTCKRVIAIDIDPEKIRMAQHNARIYGVADKVEWIVGDSLEILPRLQADAVFLSPPWGGLAYSRTHFRLDEMLVKGVSGLELFALARRVSRNVAYYLPKATPNAELERLAPDEFVECEKIFLNKQLKVVTAYYGDLARPPQEQQVRCAEAAAVEASDNACASGVEPEAPHEDLDR